MTHKDHATTNHPVIFVFGGNLAGDELLKEVGNSPVDAVDPGSFITENGMDGFFAKDYGYGEFRYE